MSQSITDGGDLCSRYTASVVNLTIHRIMPVSGGSTVGHDPTWVTIGQFERLLDAVVGRTDVNLTFDDGYASDVDLGLPRLVERGLNAEFFVLAGSIGQPGKIDKHGLRALRSAGMAIGSHGWGHRDWRRIDEPQARQEMVEAPRVIAELTGAPVTTVAIPFGSYDRHVLRRLRSAGVTRAYTSDGGRARPDRWLQARTSLHSGLDAAWIDQVLDGVPSIPRRCRGVAARTVKRLRG